MMKRSITFKVTSRRYMRFAQVRVGELFIDEIDKELWLKHDSNRAYSVTDERMITVNEGHMVEKVTIKREDLNA